MLMLQTHNRYRNERNSNTPLALPDGVCAQHQSHFEDMINTGKIGILEGILTFTKHDTKKYKPCKTCSIQRVVMDAQQRGTHM